MTLEENNMKTHKTERSKANWALKYMENSDAACNADIRFFRHRKKSQFIPPTVAVIYQYRHSHNTIHNNFCRYLYK